MIGSRSSLRGHGRAGWDQVCACVCLVPCALCRCCRCIVAIGVIGVYTVGELRCDDLVPFWCAGESVPVTIKYVPVTNGMHSTESFKLVTAGGNSVDVVATGTAKGPMGVCPSLLMLCVCVCV